MSSFKVFKQNEISKSSVHWHINDLPESFIAVRAQAIDSDGKVFTIGEYRFESQLFINPKHKQVDRHRTEFTFNLPNLKIDKYIIRLLVENVDKEYIYSDHMTVEVI